MKKIIAALLVVMSVAGISYMSVVADACDGKKKGDVVCPWVPSNMKLTKDQKTKLEEIWTDCKKSKMITRSDIGKVKTALNSLLAKEPVDKAAVDAKVDEIANLIGKALKVKMDCKVKTLALLDSEQRKTYLDSDDSNCDDDHHDCCVKDGHGCTTKDKSAVCDHKGKKTHDMKHMGSEE